MADYVDYTLTTKGLDEARRVLEKYPVIAKDVMIKAMDEVARTVASNVKLEMTRPTVRVGSTVASMPVDQGRLLSGVGGRVEVSGSVTAAGGNLRIRGVVDAGGVGYASVMEYGRRPGTWPPIAPIRRWAHLKLGDASAAFVIARKIFRRGIPGYFMFKRGWHKSKGWVSKRFRRAVKEVADKLVSK